MVFTVDKQKVLWRQSPFSSHETQLDILRRPWFPFTHNSRSHGCTFPSGDANGIHSSSQVYNPNPGPQASRARGGWARDKSFVRSFSLSISSSLLWVKICFILFCWQRGGREVKGRREEGNREDKMWEVFQVWVLAAADTYGYYFWEIWKPNTKDWSRNDCDWGCYFD